MAGKINSNTEEILSGDNVEVYPEYSSLTLYKLDKMPLFRCITENYRRAKHNCILACPLNIAEMSLGCATASVNMLPSPIGKLIGIPMLAMDLLMSMGIDVAQKVFPCLTMELNEVGTSVKDYTRSCVCCAPLLVGNVVLAVCQKCK